MPDVQQWEYENFLISGDVTVELNKLGAEGWEAWAFVQQQQTPEGMKWIIAFKRHKQLIVTLNTGTLHLQ